MQLSSFLLLLSSGFFVPVLTVPAQSQPINTLYFHSVNQLSLDEIDDHLDLSRQRLDGCLDGLSVPWPKSLKAKLLKIGPQPKSEQENFKNCNAVRWILIDGLLDRFRYAERNFQMNHEKLEVTLEEYKLNDSEFREALQLYAIMAKKEISGKSFKVEKHAFRRQMEHQRLTVMRNLKLIEEKLDERPNDYVLLSIRRNMYLWTTVGLLDPLYERKMLANPWLQDTGPYDENPSNNPHYDNWRLAAYDGFLAAVGLRRQFVYMGGGIRPLYFKDIGTYLERLTCSAVIERLKLVFPVANRRLEQAYELWETGLGAMSKDKQVAMKWCLGIIKDLRVWFEFMEMISIWRVPQDSEVIRYRRFSEWYITLALQYVSSAQGVELNASPSIDTAGNPEIVSAYKWAVRAWNEFLSSGASAPNPVVDPEVRIMRETEFYLIFRELLLSTPGAFPFSLKTWDFNTLRRISVPSAAGYLKQYNRSHQRGFGYFLEAVREYTDRMEKPEGLKDYAWDYGVYDTPRGFEPMFP